jgi:LysM repeat protein
LRNIGKLEPLHLLKTVTNLNHKRLQNQYLKAPRATIKKASAIAPADAAVKPGYYTVKPGDTLIRIGLDHGQNWRDIIRWNAIENPNLIEVGQVLRVLPPSAESAAEAVVVKPVTSPGTVTSGQDMPANNSNAKPPSNATETTEEAMAIWLACLGLGAFNI